MVLGTLELTHRRLEADFRIGDSEFRCPHHWCACALAGKSFIPLVEVPYCAFPHSNPCNHVLLRRPRDITLDLMHARSRSESLR